VDLPDQPLADGDRQGVLRRGHPRQKTGRPKVNPDKEPKPNVELKDVCPPDIGGTDRQPAAFSPRTGLV